MLNDIHIKVMKRNRQRSIAISDELIKEIKKATKGCLSVSGFVRMAVVEKLGRQQKLN